MAIDSVQKRMSAINPSAPWRGALVDATVTGFTQGNRQAAAFMYSGILAGEATVSGQTGFLCLLGAGAALCLMVFGGY